jgi:hypothetical protein
MTTMMGLESITLNLIIVNIGIVNKEMPRYSDLTNIIW